MKEYSVEDIRDLAAKSWSEKQFQATVNQALRTFGWTFIHLRPAFTGVNGKPGSKWAGRPMIITSYDGTDGFPDVVAMKGTYGLAWELKVGKNRASDAQIAWIGLFKANGFDARVCYPCDLQLMLDYLGEA